MEELILKAIPEKYKCLGMNQLISYAIEELDKLIAENRQPVFY